MVKQKSIDISKYCVLGEYEPSCLMIFSWHLCKCICSDKTEITRSQTFLKIRDNHMSSQLDGTAARSYL